MPQTPIVILDVPIDNLSEDAAIDVIASYVADGTPHQIATVNPEFLIEAQRNPFFRHVLLDADLRTADGVGLMLVGKLRRTPFCGRVTGSDLTVRLGQEAAARGWRVFLLGAAPGVAEQAAARLEADNPGLQIAGCFPGDARPRGDHESTAAVMAARPDIVLVAYGHPAQEMWIARNKYRVQAPVFIGVGGAFDYVAGVVPRAPRLIRRFGLEWLFRLVRQPWRWQRMARSLPVFVLASLREQWHVIRTNYDKSW